MATTADAWWTWHDQDYSRASATMAEAKERCAMWVAGTSDDGPDRVEPAPPADDGIACTLRARGNGLPDVGDYVAGDDGEVYEVVEIGRIHPGERPGMGDWMPGRVRLADWSDVTDETEPTASCELPRDDA